VWRWDQGEPFGANPANDDPDGNSVAFDLPLRLPGQRYDQETGLHYNYFRDYDPSLGRYAESDPIGLDGGLNTYAYVTGSPLSHDDQEGLIAGTGALGGVGSSAVGLSGTAAAGAVGLAGAAGFALGTWIYPRIEPDLSRVIDWVCKAEGKSRIERCNDAFKNCLGWRTDPKWKNRCGLALQQCLNTDLPVLFPSGDIVK